MALALAVLPAQALWAEPPSWDIQFVEPVDLMRDVTIMDLDPDNHSAEEIAALKARGVAPLCYVSVGTIEDYRGDIGDFPAGVIGKRYGDWPDERFLDIRQRDILLPLMRARFERCKAMGFSGVEPDNQDVHDNDSGFPVSADDSVAWLTALATMAHGMGLSIGQKNIPDLTPRLVGLLDFAVTEACFDDDWCGQMQPYLDAGKPVLAIEYTDTDVDFADACAMGRATGISFILKNRALDAPLITCP